MFEIDNKQIGAYVSQLIETKFDSGRQFCREYLKATGEKEIFEDEINKMANRLSQIKKGAKAIQIYDLPIFSKLLNVSFEQILSAGKCGIAKNNRMTNYTIAQSYNKEDWITYIEMKEKPILYPDEYGKNVLEYAIEFRNFAFIKFLLEKKYIWFDNGEKEGYFFTFGAGTSIERTEFLELEEGTFIRHRNFNRLDFELKKNDFYSSFSYIKEVRLYKELNMVSFRGYIPSSGIITNIVKVTKKSKDEEINKLIEKLNELYYKICNIEEITEVEELIKL